jgi:hypothetical protein
MNGAEKSPWIRVTSPHGGGDKGMFFIPEIGEEAIIGFEGDSPVKPYVIGTVYHGKAKNSYSNAGNDVKALQTRSGNKMVMNDKDGSVYMSDKGGANSMMDGAGNILTNANKDTTLNAGVNSTINAGSQAAINVGAKDGGPAQALIAMDAAGNIVIDGKTSITIKVGGNIITISKDGITTTAEEGDIKLNASAGKYSVHSTSEMNVTTDAALAIAGGPTTKISATEVQINQS